MCCTELSSGILGRRGASLERVHQLMSQKICASQATLDLQCEAGLMWGEPRQPLDKSTA